MNTILHATSNLGPLTQPKIHTVLVKSHAMADNDCETRGLSYTVELQEIAPSLIVFPDFRCANCGIELEIELANG